MKHVGKITVVDNEAIFLICSGSSIEHIYGILYVFFRFSYVWFHFFTGSMQATAIKYCNIA